MRRFPRDRVGEAKRHGFPREYPPKLRIPRLEISTTRRQPTLNMPPKAFPTHFLCIPLAGGQLSRTLASFRADVTSPLSFGVPQDAVRPLGTLHLTLGVMSLKEETLERAVALLGALRYREILARARTSSTTPATQRGTAADQGSSEGRDDRLSITLQGLHPMHEVSKTSVLYAPPTDTEGTLYRFCETIKGAFLDAGLMTDDGRPLLLHATIVNTVYVRGGRGATRGGRRERLTLDARDIVNRYEDYVWMEDMLVNKIALCRMGARRIEGTDDEAYLVEAEANF